MCDNFESRVLEEQKLINRRRMRFHVKFNKRLPNFVFIAQLWYGCSKLYFIYTLHSKNKKDWSTAFISSETDKNLNFMQ